MSTSSPWAQAVEAGAVALYHDASPSHDSYFDLPNLGTERHTSDVVLRAALPHLLRATCDGLSESDLVEVWLKGEYGGMAHRVATETMRAALRAALTAAAGRLP